tara:strand:- start:973 stop:1908 length:936 start_codon:yes stop_codon:yes gene_type:complete
MTTNQPKTFNQRLNAEIEGLFPPCNPAGKPQRKALRAFERLLNVSSDDMSTLDLCLRQALENQAHLPYPAAIKQMLDTVRDRVARLYRAIDEHDAQEWGDWENPPEPSVDERSDAPHGDKVNQLVLTKLESNIVEVFADEVIDLEGGGRDILPKEDKLDWYLEDSWSISDCCQVMTFMEETGHVYSNTLFSEFEDCFLPLYKWQPKEVFADSVCMNIEAGKWCKSGHNHSMYWSVNYVDHRKATEANAAKGVPTTVILTVEWDDNDHPYYVGHIGNWTINPWNKDEMKTKGFQDWSKFILNYNELAYKPQA